MEHKTFESSDGLLKNLQRLISFFNLHLKLLQSIKLCLSLIYYIIVKIDIIIVSMYITIIIQYMHAVTQKQLKHVHLLM